MIHHNIGNTNSYCKYPNYFCAIALKSQFHLACTLWNYFIQTYKVPLDLRVKWYAYSEYRKLQSNPISNSLTIHLPICAALNVPNESCFVCYQNGLKRLKCPSKLQLKIRVAIYPKQVLLIVWIDIARL